MRFFLLSTLVIVPLHSMHNTPEYQHKRIAALQEQEKKEKKLQENGYKEDINQHKNEHTKYEQKKLPFIITKKDK